MSTLIKPSSLLPKGLQTQTINNLTLFKFTDELGDRLQELLDKKKDDQLTSEEAIELETIGELDSFFSYINATLATGQSEVLTAQVNGNS
ncbi:MAG: hypothetical protein VKJ24_22090 [Synechococcales bacterium]|nr:hypothetical protein [Synechococcales bacterium]